MRDSLQRNKNELKIEKEEGNSLRIIVRYMQILIDRIRGTREITIYEEEGYRGGNVDDDGFFDPRSNYGET